MSLSYDACSGLTNVDLNVGLQRNALNVVDAIDVWNDLF